MKIIGIVSEYNPFHKGHQYQIDTSKSILEADGVIAMMSGHFVQRGLPAFVDKWTRAEMAISCGANLVLELPTYYATSSAESFAHGAVGLLNATGVVTDLSFGSETDNLEILMALSEFLSHETTDYKTALSLHLSKGVSFPKARDLAIVDTFKTFSDLNLNQSNVILGIEYLKALMHHQSQIKPFLVKRIGKGYHDESVDSPYASATAIRKIYFETHGKALLSQWMPEPAALLLNQYPYQAVKMSDYEKMLFFMLRRESPEALRKYRDVSEGIEHKIAKLSTQTHTYDALVQGLKSKRFTQTRIHRMLLSVLLGIEPIQLDIAKDGYLRVLAMDAKGKDILHHMKKTASLPVINNINKISPELKNNPLLKLDQRASDLYYMAQNLSQNQLGATDKLRKVIIKEEAMR